MLNTQGRKSQYMKNQKTVKSIKDQVKFKKIYCFANFYQMIESIS